MDSEDKLFLILKKPSLNEMVEIMNQFHSSVEYLNDTSIPAEERSRRKLAQFGWEFESYCIAIGTM